MALTGKPYPTDDPCVFIAEQDRGRGTATPSSILPGTYRWRAKAAPYDDSDYVGVTLLGAETGGLNAFTYHVGTARPSNLIGKGREPLSFSNIYRLVLQHDNNKDDAFQQVEKLVDEEMVQYDYKRGFIGRSINGEVDVRMDASNEDIVIPAASRGATQTYGT